MACHRLEDRGRGREALGPARVLVPTPERRADRRLVDLRRGGLSLNSNNNDDDDDDDDDGDDDDDAPPLHTFPAHVPRLHANYAFIASYIVSNCFKIVSNYFEFFEL